MTNDLEPSVYALQMDILACRDSLQQIVDGTMERERSIAGQREYHTGQRGMKKVTLKDARKIAKYVVWKINRALDDFEKPTN